MSTLSVANIKSKYLEDFNRLFTQDIVNSLVQNYDDDTKVFELSQQECKDIFDFYKSNNLTISFIRGVKVEVQGFEFDFKSKDKNQRDVHNRAVLLHIYSYCHLLATVFENQRG